MGDVSGTNVATGGETDVASEGGQGWWTGVAKCNEDGVAKDGGRGLRGGEPYLSMSTS